MDWFGGYVLVRIDTQVMEDNLVVKGVFSLWTDADPHSYFENLLDTDLDASTGEFIINEFKPGSPAIGADYKFTVRSLLVRILVIEPIYSGLME